MTDDADPPETLLPADSPAALPEEDDPSNNTSPSEPAATPVDTALSADGRPCHNAETESDSDGAKTIPASGTGATAPVSETIRWRYACATAQGPSHIKHGVSCQDVAAGSLVLPEPGSEYVILAVADGAGSASRADLGAELACSLVTGELAQLIELDKSLVHLDRDRAAEIVAWCASRIASVAEAGGANVRDYATTLLVAVLGPAECAFLQVGDGVIVIRGVESEDEYSAVFWPDRGQYANETFFLTDEIATDRFMFERRAGEIAEVALVTDGIQPLVLNYVERLVHSPFFSRTFGFLASEEPGFRETVSDLLSEALASPAFAERHDDDKGIAIASRVRTTT